MYSSIKLIKENVLMQYFKNILVILFSFALISTVHALTLDQAMNQYVNKVVRKADAESMVEAKINDDEFPYKYGLDSKKVIKKDIDGDQIADYVVMFSFCEKHNCHITTSFSSIVVFKGFKNNQVRQIDEVDASYLPSFKVLPNNTIEITDYGYGEDDPSCCPDDISKRTYKLSNGILMRVK